jgi:large subunit ribosomal protein L30
VLITNYGKMAKIKVKQVKSSIKKPQNQKRTLEALGLKRIGQVVEHDNTKNILGMINKVQHLVSIEEA